MALTRNEIISAIYKAIEPRSDVNAMWLGGSDAFQRTDELSDIDVQMNVAVGSHEPLFGIIEDVLSSLSQISRKYRLPEPTWHGHHQCFYDLHDASEYNQVDLVLMELGKEPRFNELEQHGNPVILFDKLGIIKAEPMDREALREKLNAHMDDLRQRFAVFQSLIPKEVQRGDALAALNFYNGLTLRPLVELLRIKHDPCRHTFGIRYTHYDLPDDVRIKLESLYFVSDLADLEKKHRTAVAWFNEVSTDLSIDSIEL